MRQSGNNIITIVNNLLVSYTVAGPDESPVIIFVHGFPLDKTMWDKQMDALKANYQVIAYDIRGHGNSETGKNKFSIDLFVSDLIAFMDVLNIQKASLCGLSMGGYIVLNAVENYPERFESIVLSDTSCMDDSPETREKRMKSIESIQENGVENYAGESVKKLFLADSFATKVTEIAAVKQMILKTTIRSLSKTLFALSRRSETCSKLPEIKLPALIMVGAEDEITPPEASKFMHENIKGSVLHIVKHAGHLSNLENPDDFNKQLKLFFDGVYNMKPL